MLLGEVDEGPLHIGHRLREQGRARARVGRAVVWAQLSSSHIIYIAIRPKAVVFSVILINLALVH